jgi:hypothetical protein
MAYDPTAREKSVQFGAVSGFSPYPVSVSYLSVEYMLVTRVVVGSKGPVLE